MRRLAGPVAGCLLALVSIEGCYSLQPLPTTDLKTGSVVAFDINDAGRVGLGGAMGPEIDQLEGRVYGTTADAVDVAVTRIRLLRGGEQVWKGERITVRNEYIVRRYERQFSKGRTIAASAVGAGVVVYLLSRSIFVKATQGDNGKVPGDTSNSVRRPVGPLRP